MISGHTGILGVIGDPVEHTSSPAMHNAALQALGLDYVYVAFHVAASQIRQAIAGLRGLAIRGLNVTVPHKQAVMAELDAVSEEARRIGAVNTIVNEGGHLTGHNTDAFGILESLRCDAKFESLPEEVVLVGAGGAGRAILFGLLQLPEVKKVLLCNRTVERAEGLARDLDPAGARVDVSPIPENARSPQGQRIRQAGLVINSTSVGMHPGVDVSPLEGADFFCSDMAVVDIVYKPLRTRLMQQAESAGARVFNGLGMLAYQGARSLQLWTGREPDVEVMKGAALKRVEAG